MSDKFSPEWIAEQREVMLFVSYPEWKVLWEEGTAYLVNNVDWQMARFSIGASKTPYAVVAAVNNYVTALDEIERLQAENKALQWTIGSRFSLSCTWCGLEAPYSAQTYEAVLSQMNEHALHCPEDPHEKEINRLQDELRKMVEALYIIRSEPVLPAATANQFREIAGAVLAAYEARKEGKE